MFRTFPTNFCQSPTAVARLEREQTGSWLWTSPKVVSFLLTALVVGWVISAARPVAAQSLDVKFSKQQTARDLYTQAAASLVSKDMPQAISALSKLVEQFPQDELAPLAALRLGQCLVTTAKYQEAILVLEKWIPELAKSTKARLFDPVAELNAQATLARAYLMTEQYGRVIELAEKVTAQSSNINVLSEGEQRALQQVKSFAGAATARREAGQAGPLREAARLVRDKQYTQAQAELAKVDASLLGLDWKWRYYVLCAQCQLGLSKPQQATVELNRIDVEALQPKEQAVVRMLRLEAAMAAGTLAVASQELEALSSTVKQDPHQAATLDLRRAELALLRKDRDAVDQITRAAKDKYPGFDSLHEFDLMRARNLLARIEFEEARQLLTQIVASPPAHDPTAVPRAHWLMGESYLLAQDYQRALEHYSQVIDSNRAPVWTESALMQRGKCFEMLGQVSEAEKDYRRLTSQFPASSLNADARARINQIQR